MNQKCQIQTTTTANPPYQSRTRGASLRRLANTLKQAGYPTRIQSFPDGTRLLLLPQGGRVLGVYPPKSDLNFLWTHDALHLPKTARALYTEACWPNPGGDRTWLAPVPEFFFSDMRKLWETFREPVALDPGRYVCENRGGLLRLVNHQTLRLFRSKTTAKAEIAKHFQPACNPLRYEPAFDAAYEYAGYASVISLRLLSDPEKVGSPLGLYQLLQLPAGGEMIMPTHSPARPLVMFGKIPAGHLKSEPHAVLYRMASKVTAKIALRAVHTTGRIGYVHQSEPGRYDLIIRNIFVNPSGEYVDPPFDDLKDRGYSIQACNVAERTLGFFNELEHHVPAVGRGTGSAAGTDVSQVRAFRGSRKAIGHISRLLLGCTPQFASSD
jgi:hypothetical protein